MSIILSKIVLKQCLHACNFFHVCNSLHSNIPKYIHIHTYIHCKQEENPLQQTFKNLFLGIRCNFCDFSVKSERGLKTHKSRKHCNCNWCDFTCKDESELKEHKLDKHSMEYSVEILQSCYL